MASFLDDPVAFPVLSQADIAAVDRFGSRCPIAVGDALYREGAVGYDFFVVIAGGGNSAGQAAMFLADSGNPVTLVIRSPDIATHMSRHLVDRIQIHPRITVRTGSQVTALQGQGRLESVQITNVDGHCTVECDAVFSFIGAE